MWYGFLFFVPLILIAVLLFVFWIMMLVDSVKRKYSRDSDKIVWVLVIILTGLIGALIYYFVIFYGDKGKSMKWFWITLLVLFLLSVLMLALIVISSVNVVGPEISG